MYHIILPEPITSKNKALTTCGLPMRHSFCPIPKGILLGFEVQWDGYMKEKQRHLHLVNPKELFLSWSQRYVVGFILAIHQLLWSLCWIKSLDLSVEIRRDENLSTGTYGGNFPGWRMAALLVGFKGGTESSPKRAFMTSRSESLNVQYQKYNFTTTLSKRQSSGQRRF